MCRYYRSKCRFIGRIDSKSKEGKFEDIMREKDTQYIDKTCVIDDGKDGNASMEDTLKIINDYNS